ncbi:MAG: hypothetical protein Q8O27_01630 [Enterobacteriaceae bacterium]|nr:hypothetical protein [Enterobacteriaceae bacterium]
MLEDNYQILKEEKKVYPPIPKNVYQVELLEISLNDAKGKFAKPGDKNFAFQFTLLSGSDKGESLRGRNVWNNFVPTILYIGKNGKNSLYGIVEAFLGRELTPQEEAEGLTGKMLNSFIGAQIKVFIDHRVKGDKIYDTITSYMPADSKDVGLTAEEKENARVKVKKEEPKEVYEPNDENPPVGEEEILSPEQLAEIPF